MNLGLLIVIFVVILGLIGYTMFLVRQHNAMRYPRMSSHPPFEGRPSKATISDSQIYKETKGLIKSLRTKLDRFTEAVDAISTRVKDSTNEEQDTAYTEGIPKMHQALVDAITATEVLLAAVEKRPLKTQVQVEMVGYRHHAPRDTKPDGQTDNPRASHPFVGLISTVAKVNPNIAGFYLELTQEDEKSQMSGAAAQTELILDHLGNALDELIEIEKKLSE